MKSYCFASSAVLALMLGLHTSAHAQTKPADLPAHNQIDCPDGSDDPVRGPRYFPPYEPYTLPKELLDLEKAATAATISAYIEQLAKDFCDALAAATKRAQENSAKSRSLEVRLFDPINVRIEHVPLKNAINNLRTASGLPIAIDFKAMRDAGIDLDAPVTLNNNRPFKIDAGKKAGVRTKSVYQSLRDILDSQNLTFEIKNDVVWISVSCKNQSVDSNVAQLIADRMFENAEFERRRGDYSKAHFIYQKIHVLVPTSIVGRVAMERIAEIEEQMRANAEEQDIPRSDNPEEAFQRMLDRTIPLGLVEVSY